MIKLGTVAAVRFRHRSKSRTTIDAKRGGVSKVTKRNGFRIAITAENTIFKNQIKEESR